MKKVIYIIEDKIAELINNRRASEIDTHADFITTDKGETLRKSSISAGQIAGQAISLQIAPTFGLLSAIAMVAPLILNSDSDKQSDENISTTKKQNEISDFIAENGITIAEANRLNFKFPPGHPFIGQTYRLHPLAELKGSKKSTVYIPNDQYDELILAERESELFRLLVDLGAIKISITELTDKFSTEALQGKFSAGNLVASGQIEYSDLENTTNTSTNERVYELEGKKWHKNDFIDRSNYGWLHFEPSWESLVFAREIGGCLKARLEIKEKTSFSFDRSIALELKSKFFQTGVNAEKSNNLRKGQIYSIYAEFSATL